MFVTVLLQAMYVCVFVPVDSSFAPREFRANYLKLKSDVWLLVLEIVVFGTLQLYSTATAAPVLPSAPATLCLVWHHNHNNVEPTAVGFLEKGGLKTGGAVHALSSLVWCTRYYYLGQKPRDNKIWDFTCRKPRVPVL